MPARADIYINRSRYNQKTPASIEGLIPGNYKITLRSKGYKPWVQTISVGPGKAYSFKDILLIPKVWPIKNLSTAPFARLAPLKGTDYFITGRAPNLGSYAVYELKTGKAIHLLPADSHLFDLPVISIFTQDNSPVFVIYAGSLWNYKYLYVDITKTIPEILDISRLIQVKPLDIGWNDFKRGRVFTLYRDYVNLLDVESMSIFPHYMENIRGYGLYLKWIYAISRDNNVFKQTYDKKEEGHLPYGPKFGKRFFGQTEFYKIKVLQDNIILFLSRNGKLITNLPPYNLIDRGVIGLEFYKNPPGLLCWTKHSIGIVDFVQKSYRGSFINKTADQRIIYGAGTNITDCVLANEGSHVLFDNDNKLYLLEVEPQGGPHIELITAVKEDSSFFYSDETGYVYYLDPQSGYLNSIELFPR